MLLIITLLPWIVLVLLAAGSFMRRPRLARFEPATTGPLVSVIVPARDEAANIGICLATLAHTCYRDTEIIVVDDESRDGTADVVRAMMERSDRAIRLVEGQPLPDGWFGKPWACWQGFQKARGELLLFTDADTRHEEELLGCAVTAQRQTGADLVTVIPEQELHTLWERLVMPQIMFMIGTRYRAPKMNRAKNPHAVVANGQFILMPRASYEAVGGHAALKGEVVEDLRMAQRVVAAGRKLFTAHAEELMQTRMYRSLSGIVEGWSKNVAIGSRLSVPAPLRPFVPWSLAVFLVLAWVVPPAALIAGAFGLVRGALVWWSLWATILTLVFWLLMNLRMHVPSLYTLLHPIGALVAAGIVVRSALRGERRVEWRGRRYASGGREAPHPD